MNTKYDIGDTVWYLATYCGYSGDWEGIEAHKAHIDSIYVTRTEGINTRYTLDVPNPHYGRINSIPWAFNEEELFDNLHDAQAYLKYKRREYLQKELDKAQKVVDDWQKKLEEV